MGNYLIDGGGAREASIASRLLEDSGLDTRINAVMPHENPTILSAVEESGGTYLLGDHKNPELVADFANSTETTLAIVSSDEPLANGVVDAVKAYGIDCVGPEQSAARIEYDKVFMRELVEDIRPELNPFFRVARNHDEIGAHLSDFEGSQTEVVVKPSGLTGGKGVKVMGEHFDSYDDAEGIAHEILEDGHSAVLLEEKISKENSVEFTVQAFTDGEVVVLPPPTVDYPYRFDGDEGPGTGGMGAFSDRELPSFLTEREWETAAGSIEDIISEMSRRNLKFNGVLNVGFFVSPIGMKIIECNARPGDPECMNMMLLLDSDVPKTMQDIANTELTSRQARFKEAASTVVYLVSRSYALGEGDYAPTTFRLDEEALETAGARTFFGSARRVEGHESLYSSVGNSRALALGALGESLSEARSKVYRAVQTGVHGDLDYRNDIASAEYVESLKRRRNM